jgi:hypothetical protein
LDFQGTGITDKSIQSRALKMSGLIGKEGRKIEKTA